MMIPTPATPAAAAATAAAATIALCVSYHSQPASRRNISTVRLLLVLLVH